MFGCFHEGILKQHSLLMKGSCILQVHMQSRFYKLLFGFHKDRYIFRKYDIYGRKSFCNRCYTDTG
ncbi:hypothetical protein DXA38_07660 [[Clostridium] innocuum]|uniref:Uncharacterized protein n=1 Tax=Clostridium innocuum TaxID=1522 RepID=A0A3E2VYQ4_CLOIN|nr:hypothetical protein DXA38_07660 [[Clostridium] innocuum]RHV68153.1 hypothetical protein DXB22_03705 [Clostridiaceae bacterium OM02-2AC]